MTTVHSQHIVACICRHVHEGSAPLLQIIRHFGGLWEFNCAKEDHPEIDDFLGLCDTCNEEHLKEFLMLKDLKPGEWARRENSLSRDWEFFLLPPEEENQA